MNYITRYQLFRNAYRGLEAQGWVRAGARMIDMNGNELPGVACRYRDADGRKCAIGHSIPDDRYEPAEMEGRRGQTVLELAGVQTMAGDDEFITLLQKAHDFAATPEDVKRNFDALAQIFSIKLQDEAND